MIPIGFTLQPELEFLELLGGVIEDEPDYYEVTPETLWRYRDGELQANGYNSRFRALQQRTRRPLVAHGVGLSMGTADASDADRRAQWLQRMKADHAAFRFLWYTEHLGASSLGGQAVTLPLPLPMTPESAAIVRDRLRSMQQVVPDVGVENNVAYFLLGDAMEEPGFLADCVSAPNTHLVLDFHNVHTMALNFGFDPEAYLAKLPLDRVIEIHLSGGSWSDGSWLPSGRIMRLDSHEEAIPEEVWTLFEKTWRRCTNLRGVTFERMEGTVTDADVPLIREELHRIRQILRSAG